MCQIHQEYVERRTGLKISACLNMKMSTVEPPAAARTRSAGHALGLKHIKIPMPELSLRF
jgi:hypothetical protein